MPQLALRGRRPRTHIIPRSLVVRAAGTIVATAAVLAAAPAAAQASAALPGPAMVPCTSTGLVTAIQNANNGGPATLLLARGCTYTLTTAAAGNDGLPPVTGTITLIGGHGTQISRDPTAPPFRILDVAAGGTLTLVNLTVANGKLTGDRDFGGGIQDLGALVLRNVRLTGNSVNASSSRGGGLFVDGAAQATISGSELDHNSAGGGGAISSSGAVTIDQSTLARNTADFGGAIDTGTGSTTRISGTVVTGNRAGREGGGILNEGAMTLRGGLVAFNQASEVGGGILNAPALGTVSLRFTVVAFNTPDNCFPQGTIPGCQH